MVHVSLNNNYLSSRDMTIIVIAQHYSFRPLTTFASHCQAKHGRTRTSCFL